jgi:hypothetical protein
MADEYKDVIRVHDDDADFTGTRLKDKMFGFAPDTNKFIARVGNAYKKAATEGTDTFYNQLSVGYSATPLTREKLDINGALVVGEATDENDGTIQYANDEFSFREDGAWKTLGSALYNSLTDRPTLITKEPTGFVNPADVIVTYNNTTRIVTLTGDVSSVYNNVPMSEIDPTFISGWESDPHDDEDGVFWLQYDGVSLAWATEPDFRNLTICLVYVDGVTVCIRECHGLMQWQSHKIAHQTIGTYLTSGADSSGVELNSITASARQPVISQAVINDEDLPTTIAQISSGSYAHLRLVGSGAAPATEYLDQTEIVSVTGAKPNYNQFVTGAWQQTPMTNNYFQKVFLMLLPVSAGTECQKRRGFFIQGQAEFATLSACKAVTFASVNLGQLDDYVPEFVAVYEFIIQYKGPATNDWVIIEQNKILGTKASQVTIPSGNFLSSVAVDGTTITGNGADIALSSISSPKLTTARTISGVSFDGTANITLTAANVGAEAALGNPATSGFILSSTTAGVRSWIDPLWTSATNGMTTSKTGISINGATLATNNSFYSRIAANANLLELECFSTTAAHSAQIRAKKNRNNTLGSNGNTVATDILFDFQGYGMYSNTYRLGGQMVFSQTADGYTHIPSRFDLKLGYGTPPTTGYGIRTALSVFNSGLLEMPEILSSAPSVTANYTGLYADTSGNLWSLGTAGTRLLNAWKDISGVVINYDLSEGVSAFSPTAAGIRGVLVQNTSTATLNNKFSTLGLAVQTPTAANIGRCYFNYYLPVADDGRGILGITMRTNASGVGTYATPFLFNPEGSLQINNGTASTPTDGAKIYAVGGEMWVKDASGNATQISPHDENGEWVYNSTNTETGKTLKIKLEKMLKFLEAKFGTDFIEEINLP